MHILIHHAQVGSMDQSSCLERGIWALWTEMFLGKPAKFLVDDRHQFIRCCMVRQVGFINRAFGYANSAGMTIVVAAGNGSLNLDKDGNQYKMSCSTPHRICVSATGPASSNNPYFGPWYDIDNFAPYSNFGRSAVDVAAPGGTNAGYIPGSCSQTSLAIPGCRLGPSLVAGTGTSFSAPLVSGLAALMVEQYRRNSARVRARILQSADDLGDSGKDPYYGSGRINIGKAIN